MTDELDQKIDEVDAKVAEAKKTKRIVSPEKAAERAQAAVDKDAKKAARAAAKAEREAARAARKVHMAKVDRAAQNLPTLSEEANELFQAVIADLPHSQVAALAMHLNHFNRATATEAATKLTLTVGQTVRIIGGDAKFIDRVGTVSKVQRIRCLVEVEGMKKPAYVFLSEVEVLESDEQEAAEAV